MTVSVRDALSSDADAVTDAHVRAWQVGCRGIVPDALLDHPDFDRRQRDGWRYRLEHGPSPGSDPENRIVVAVVADRVVGFAHTGRQVHRAAGRHDGGELYGLYVHPDWWGHGAADALMAAALAELRTRFTSAGLWVLCDAQRARRFYERTGWTIRRTHEGDLVEEPWPLPVVPGAPIVSGTVGTIQYGIALV